MDDDRMNRIEAFLKSHGLDVGSVPKQRIKQLEEIDDAIQWRLEAITEAQKIIKDSSISIASIAADSGITRKTFYNNEILKQYVESFTYIDNEPGKLVKVSEIESMKKQIKEQADDINKMVARDIDVEALRYEADELRKVIDAKNKQIQNLTEMYESTLAQLQDERYKNRTGRVIPFEKKEEV